MRVKTGFINRICLSFFNQHERNRKRKKEKKKKRKKMNIRTYSKDKNRYKKYFKVSNTRLAFKNQ